MAGIVRTVLPVIQQRNKNPHTALFIPGDVNKIRLL